MARYLIGIDDTDNLTSPGTGQLARELAREAESRGARLLGITRHQFLVDPRIPYTTHNSGACIAVEWPGAIDSLMFAMDLIAQWSAEGSDPGVCIAREDAVPPAVKAHGWRATREVLTIEQALITAQEAGLALRPLGGTGQGVIGALASVGLRADGNEGRFLELPGLREFGDEVYPEDLSRIGVTVQFIDFKPSEYREPKCRTMGWIRPRLVGGLAVWPVEWSDNDNAWIPVDRKRSRPLE